MFSGYVLIDIELTADILMIQDNLQKYFDA